MASLPHDLALRLIPEGEQRFYATRAGRTLAVAAAVLALVTVAGLALLWPSGPAKGLDGLPQAVPTLGAEVASVRTLECPGPSAQRCTQVRVRLGEGPDAGRFAPITLGPSQLAPDLRRGDPVRVDRVDLAPGARADAERYTFSHVDRRGSLWWLLGAFCLLLVVLARWRGVLALAGLAGSILLVTEFLVPAILAGESAVLVALVGALAVMWVTLVLTSGLGAQTLAAAIGIAASLGLTVALGWAWIGFSDLQGLSGELGAVLVTDGGAGISLQGVVLAGLAVGALGVLTDMAVSQAATVLAVRRANPLLRARDLYREGFAVGRDHLAATVHTLVLAYVGSALPLLLVLQASGMTTADALGGEEVAEAVVTTLVGSIGLVAAVPLTTGLAALLAVRVPPAALPAHGHAH